MFLCIPILRIVSHSFNCCLLVSSVPSPLSTFTATTLAVSCFQHFYQCEVCMTLNPIIVLSQLVVIYGIDILTSTVPNFPLPIFSNDVNPFTVLPISIRSVSWYGCDGGRVAALVGVEKFRVEDGSVLLRWTGRYTVITSFSFPWLLCLSWWWWWGISQFVYLSYNQMFVLWEWYAFCSITTQMWLEGGRLCVELQCQYSGMMYSAFVYNCAVCLQ